MTTWFDYLFRTIIVAIIIIVVLIIDRIMMYLIRRAAKRQKVPLETMNGAKILVRIIVIVLIIFALLTYIPNITNYIVSLSTLTGVIIGFAANQVVSQFIAGIYLLSSRPFRVNDLVNVMGTDGLILEIGLNFTTLQMFSGAIVKIPNKSILDTEVQKYSVKLTPEIRDKIKSTKKLDSVNDIKNLEMNNDLKADKEKKKQKRNANIKKVKNVLMEDYIIRYTFDMAFDLDKVPKQVIQAVNNVCDKHERIYEFRPQFIIDNIYWRVHFKFKIYCYNPYTIIMNHSHFIKDIMVAIFGGK